MKTTRTFTMNGNTYTSMMDIARELGVKRVYPRDFVKYGIVETTGQDATQVADDDVVEANEVQADTQVVEDTTAEAEDTSKADEQVDENQEDEQPEENVKTDEQPKVDKRFTRKLGTPEQVKEAQENAGKMSLVDFNNYIKHFTVDALVELADAAGVKNWDTIDNEPIRKMRLLMEIKAYYYPQEKIPVKPNSEWRKVELADLLKLAKKNKLDFKKSDDEKIQRMWVIMAIKAANLTLADLPQKTQEKDDKQVAAND